MTTPIPTGTRADFDTAMEKAKGLTAGLDEDAWEELKEVSMTCESMVRLWFSNLVANYIGPSKTIRIATDVPLKGLIRDERRLELGKTMRTFRLGSDTGRIGLRAGNPDIIAILRSRPKEQAGSSPGSVPPTLNVQLVAEVKKAPGKVATGVIDQLMWYFAIAYALFKCKYAIYFAPDRAIVFERDGDVIWMPSMEPDGLQPDKPLAGAHEIDSYVFANCDDYAKFKKPKTVRFKPLDGKASLRALRPMTDVAAALDNIRSVMDGVSGGTEGIDELEVVEEIASHAWKPIDRWTRMEVQAADEAMKHKRLDSLIRKPSRKEGPGNLDPAGKQGPAGHSSGRSPQRDKREYSPDRRQGSGEGRPSGSGGQRKHVALASEERQNCGTRPPVVYPSSSDIQEVYNDGPVAPRGSPQFDRTSEDVPAGSERLDAGDSNHAATQTRPSTPPTTSNKATQELLRLLARGDDRNGNSEEESVDVAGFELEPYQAEILSRIKVRMR